MINFAEYAPDRAGLDPNVTDAIKNCLPQQNTWGPFNALSPITDALPAEPRGGILGRLDDQSFTVYVGTSDKLFQGSGGAWNDRSGAVYNLPTGQRWSFLQFGSYVFAGNIGNALQYNMVQGGVNFQDTPGAPQGSSVFRAASCVVVAGISGFPKRVHWSDVGKPLVWTDATSGPRQGLSDFQDLPIPGTVLGGSGDENGAVIATTTGFYRMTFLPGSRAVFRFDEINPSTGKGNEPSGIIAPNSLVQFGPRTFYLSENGFAELGLPPRYIGNERIDKSFLADADLDFIAEVEGVADPVTKNIFWRYRSGASGTGATDKIIAYNVLLDKWSGVIEQDLTELLTIASPGYTLDELETVLGYTLVNDVPGTTDSRQWKGGRPGLAGFDTSYKLGQFTGDTLEAVLETADVNLKGEGRVPFVNGFRPVIDVAEAPCFGQVGGKLGYKDPVQWTNEAQENVTGIIPGRKSARLHRFRVRIPAGTNFNHAIGVETPESTAGGMR